MKLITISIPAYNEEESILHLYSEVTKVMDKVKEIIILNSFSLTMEVKIKLLNILKRFN